MNFSNFIFNSTQLFHFYKLCFHCYFLNQFLKVFSYISIQLLSEFKQTLFAKLYILVHFNAGLHRTTKRSKPEVYFHLTMRQSQALPTFILHTQHTHIYVYAHPLLACLDVTKLLRIFGNLTPNGIIFHTQHLIFQCQRQKSKYKNF